MKRATLHEDKANNNLDETVRKKVKRAIEGEEEEKVAEETIGEDKNDGTNVAGRVASVHLQNFMCHGNLEIDFDTVNNNCFYIGGPNGSGKSALFAAINLGLGGRGSDNERGNAVRSYVKEGKSSAKIRIVLTNTGSNARRDFGDFVAIERSITQSSSTYHLKGITVNGDKRTERVISKKKSDIDELIQHFNIHLTNPVFWMSQDRSRSFLANMKPSNVYKLYIEATLLDVIKEKYVKFGCDLEDLETILLTNERDLSRKQEQLSRMQEVQQLNDKLEEQKQEVAEIKWKLIFCPSRDARNELVIWENKFNKLVSKIEHIGKKTIENRTDRQRKNGATEDCEKRVIEKKAKLDQCRGSLQELADEKAAVYADIRQVTSEMKTKAEEKMSLKRKIQGAERNIEELRRSMENDVQKNQLLLAERQLETLTKQLREEEQSGNQGAFEKQIQELIAEKNVAEQKSNEANEKMYQLRRDVARVEEDLKSYQATSVDAVNRFGYQTRAIIETLERSKNLFDQKPKGPLGRYIRLRDSKWAMPIEDRIGMANAMSYICHSARDADTLRKIFERIRIPQKELPQITIMKFSGRKYDRLMEPPADWNTVYRQIDIEDPDVHNAIIDMCGVEETLLIERDDEARRIMDGNAPDNASVAFTLSGAVAHSSSGGRQYRFYANQKQNATARGLFSDNVADKKFDVKDAEEFITAKSREIADFQSNCQKLENEAARKRHEIVQAKLKLSKHEAVVEELNKKIRYARAAVEQQQQKVEQSDEQADIDNLVSFDFSQLSRKKVDKLKEKEQEFKTSLQSFGDRQATLKSDEDLRLKDLLSEKEDLEKLREEIDALDAQYEKLDTNKTLLEQQQEKLYGEEIQLKTALDAAIAKVEKNKALAEKPVGCDDPPEMSEFPPTEHAENRLKEMIRKIERDCTQIDGNVTVETINAFKKKLMQSKRLTGQLRDFIDKLKLRLRNRAKLYPNLKLMTERRVQRRFLELLDYRKFNGALRFDHEKRTLNVVVHKKDAGPKNDEKDEDFEESHSDSSDSPPAAKKKKTQKRDTNEIQDLKGLSGGERSFVTAALVMSLWEVMDQPFRMLDEFDVFMDMLNRKVVMDLLVKMATEKFTNNQFIFFTPQGIKELDTREGLQIFEMPKVRP
ncbi:unnamed protein product [Caenorhabditis auriculariae]|uniref:Rad50/SbcC-type AAA domain-containing protein n=1 Tax=Caenorhabditis auriculariae TaxID=2777116 RepID=A0A8S1HLM3_9PELO|nr:unnamed protein product [Caenorhabditis auriculariae]